MSISISSQKLFVYLISHKYTNLEQGITKRIHMNSLVGGSARILGYRPMLIYIFRQHVENEEV